MAPATQEAPKQEEVVLTPEARSMFEALQIIGGGSKLSREGEQAVSLPSVVTALDDPLAHIAIFHPALGQIRSPNLEKPEEIFDLSKGVLPGLGRGIINFLMTDVEDFERRKNNLKTVLAVEGKNRDLTKETLHFYEQANVLNEWRNRLKTEAGFDRARQTINGVLQQTGLKMKRYEIPKIDKQIGLGPLAAADRLGYGLREGIKTLDKRGANPAKIVNQAEAGNFETLEKCQMALVIAQKLALHQLRKAAREKLKQNIKTLSSQGMNILVDRAGQAIRTDVLNEALRNASPELRERLAESDSKGESLEEEWLEKAEFLQEHAGRIYRDTLDRFRQHHFVESDPYQDPEEVLNKLLRAASETKSNPLVRKLAIKVAQQLIEELDLTEEWLNTEIVLNDAQTGGDVDLMKGKVEGSLKIQLKRPTQMLLGDTVRHGARALLDNTSLQTRAKGMSEVMNDMANVNTDAIAIIKDFLEEAMTPKTEFVDQTAFVLFQPLTVGYVLQAALLESEPERDDPANKLLDVLLMNTAEGHRVSEGLMRASASYWKTGLAAMPEAFVVAVTNYVLGVEKYRPDSDALPIEHFQTLVQCTAEMLGAAIKHLGNDEASDKIKKAAIASVGLAGGLVNILPPKEVQMMKDIIEKILKESPENSKELNLIDELDVRYVWDRMTDKLAE